ncbi:CIA30 family protein [Roseobacter sp.]|uniref:CIA30 family protein n=1 Tax=Roseobacter sp. TaxID=1907202 RepID=UPI0032985164
MMTDTYKELTPLWDYVADDVMGGVSTGQARCMHVAGRRATRLTGVVSTDNNGGFIQIASDLRVDASGWTGIEIDVAGNGETYDLRVRTDQITRPWQSFRCSFIAAAGWHSVALPFAGFTAHKTDAQFDPAQLRRVGVLAIGRVFHADVAVGGLRLYC